MVDTTPIRSHITTSSAHPTLLPTPTPHPPHTTHTPPPPPPHPDVADRSSRPWHSEPCLGPFAFWDVRGSEERQSAGASLVNRAEATCAVRLLQHLFKCYPTLR